MPATVEQFREVSSDSVSSDERAAADCTLHCVGRALGLAPVVIRWFRLLGTFDEAAIQRNGGAAPWQMFRSDERTAGRMNQGNRHEIWIRADRGPRRVALTVAHELRHIWQVPKYGTLTQAADIDAMHATLEADADDFARTAIEILFQDQKGF